MFRTSGHKAYTYYQTKIKSPTKKNTIREGLAKVPKLLMTADKSRNSKTFVQAKTEVEEQSITDESFNNISEIQLEAKIQVPTRFRSREAMMKFKGKNSKKSSRVFDVQHNIKSEKKMNCIQIQDMKADDGEFKTNEAVVGRASESSQLDAESVLKMLRVPSRINDHSPSKSSI